MGQGMREGEKRWRSEGGNEGGREQRQNIYMEKRTTRTIASNT